MRASLVLSLLFTSTSLAIPLSSPAPSSLSYDKRADDDIDPSKWQVLAVGDSYSAGVGAGTRLGDIVTGLKDPISAFNDWKCSRYDQSYPYKVARRLLGDKLKDNFQFLSCSGAVTQEVIDNQVKEVKNGKDLIMVSAGGNDAQFVHLLNACVFQFFSPTPLYAEAVEKTLVEATVRFPWLAPALAFFQKNKEPISRSCDEQLKVSTDVINGADFKARIRKMLQGLQGKLNKDGKLIYTGYVKFFDENMSKDDFCSKPENSWSVWEGKIPTVILRPVTLLHDSVTLVPEKRKKLNDIVGLMNSKLTEIVADFKDDRFLFSDYGQAVGHVDGRFCTKGVNVADDKRLKNLGIYPYNPSDPFGTEPFKRDGFTQGFNAKGTFEGDLNALATIAGLANVTYKASVKRSSREDMVKPKEKRGETFEFSVLPDGWIRTMHPSIMGHRIIANSIIWLLDTVYTNSPAKRDTQQPSYDDMFGRFESTTCPVIPATKCENNDNTSKLPAKLFVNALPGTSTGRSLFEDFCKEMDSGKIDERTNQQWTVNAQGTPTQIHQKGLAKDVIAKTLARREDYPDLKIEFNWIPAKDQRGCTMGCSTAFKRMQKSTCGSRGTQKDMMAATGSQDAYCGTYSYTITDGKDDSKAKGGPAECLKSKWQAPRGDKEIKELGGEGTSVDSAYEKWCKDNDGKEVNEKDPLVYGRWGVAGQKVPDRFSYWLSARYQKRDGCTGKDKINVDTCKRAFKEGTSTCSPNSGYTTGVVKPEGCINYSIDVSSTVVEGSPPWNAPVVKFPPPEDAESQGGGEQRFFCGSQQKSNGRPAKISDLNKAIDEYCGDGKPIEKKEYNQKKHKFTNADISVDMFSTIYKNLDFGGTTWRPVKDMNWCDNGFDWKKHKDDCVYAMRRMMYECNPNLDRVNTPFTQGQYTYRCVTWNIFAS